MDNKNGSNVINNFGKEDVNRSDYRGVLVFFGLFLIFVIVVNSLILVLIWKKRYFCIIFNIIFC